MIVIRVLNGQTKKRLSIPYKSSPPSLPNDPEGISNMQPMHAALRDPVSSLFLILPARHALPLLVKVGISHLRPDGIMLLAVA